MSNDKKINEDDLKVLHLVHNNPKISQRYCSKNGL